MQHKIIKIDIKGDNNIIITDSQGSEISLGLADLFTKYEFRLDEILFLLKDKEDKNAVSLAKNIREYQLLNKQSDFDAYNLYIEQVKTDLVAETSKVLAGKKVGQLNAKAVENLLKLVRVKSHFIKHQIADNESIEAKLRALSLMTNGYLIKGTFLCLCDIDTMRGATSSADYASFGAFSSTDKTIIRASEEVYGNLVHQYEQIYNLITLSLGALEIIDLLKRESDYRIPEIVFRELLANAFIHRDYSENAPIHTTIELYPDRLVIKNAGKFPENIDFNNPQNIDSKPINKEIARVFFLHEIIEKRGSGIARVQATLKQRGMLPAEFNQGNGVVSVTVYTKKNQNIGFKPNISIEELFKIGDYEALFNLLENEADEIDKQEILKLSSAYKGLQQALGNYQVHFDAYKTYMWEIRNSLKPLVEKYGD
jgi:predicted HTH transcriptional regulator